MPRPKSALRPAQFVVAPETPEQLDTIARHHGWLTERGTPSRSLAVRELAAREAQRIQARIEAAEMTAIHREQDRYRDG